MSEEQASVQPQGDIPGEPMSPVTVLILEIVTCGLYGLVWNKKAAETLNAVCERQVISPMVALIGAFCWPVNIYFYYLVTQCLPDLGRRIGREEELKGQNLVVLLLGVFFPPVAAMVLQGHFNELHGKPEA